MPYTQQVTHCGRLSSANPPTSKQAQCRGTYRVVCPRRPQKARPCGKIVLQAGYVCFVMLLPSMIRNLFLGGLPRSGIPPACELLPKLRGFGCHVPTLFHEAPPVAHSSAVPVSRLQSVCFASVCCAFWKLDHDVPCRPIRADRCITRSS